MATAAPASAPSAAPSAPSAPAEATPAQPIEALSAIKPIPSRKPTRKGLGLAGVGKPPTLPGVPDSIDPDEPQSEHEPVAVAPETLADAEPAAEVPADEPPAEAPPANWLELDLGDGQMAKFRDQEHLIQNLKTVRGQFRSMQQNEIDANTKAWGWSQAAQRHEATLRAWGIDPDTGQLANQAGASAPVGAPAAQGAPTDPTGAALSTADVQKELSEAVDYNVVNEFLRNQQVPHALAYIQMETGKVVSRLLAEKLPALIEQKVAPLMEHNQRQQGFDNVRSFWAQARASRDQQGNPVFPEIQTDEGQEALGRVWVALHKQHGVPLEFLMTPEGMHTAALWYRAYQAQNAPAQAPQNNPAPNPVAQVKAAVEARANQGTVVQPSARPSTPSPMARPASPQDAVKAAIRSAGASRDFGVIFDGN